MARTTAILDQTDLKESLRAAARRSMKDIIAERLATMIGSGALSVGDPLPSERELSSAMGVSRETIRGALLILSTRGILSVAQGARTTVASAEVGELGLRKVLPGMAEYDLDDVHEGRLLVEGHLARLAAHAPEARTLARLADLIEEQRRAKDDPVRYLILDREFHAVIYRSAGNQVLSDLAVTLYAYLLNHRRRAVSRPGAIGRSIADHEAILAALEARDGAAAAEAFGVHERRIYETTRRLMKTDGHPTTGGDQP
ncbi:FadR/GntR family transcriptional regulator [Jannaschia aquimarina]|uniref:Mce2R protein n=1 Tax=Jannaschia aquimarina TaxID=935700 RepID=A0A0D1CLF5_9RHOB|nr:FCD domain-containing protein [Jannaschia aquimarina]KIT15642.1 HTH-type transcriptional regulator Mce2R [Jannaschia aquimarina]SNT03294.1 transcriptional regulator, GntR family [Jannaschia aquimarina]